MSFFQNMILFCGDQSKILVLFKHNQLIYIQNSPVFGSMNAILISPFWKINLGSKFKSCSGFYWNQKLWKQKIVFKN